MALLDELKQQAEARRQQLQASQATRHLNRQAVHVALREASRYFIELADSLNVLQLPIMRHFHVSETRLEQLVQCDYNARERRKTVETQDYFEEAGLRFYCAGGQDVRIVKDSPYSIKNLRDYLWSYNFRFECREIKNDRGLVERAVFTVFAQVPSGIVFAGDWDTAQIRLTLKNIETVGEVNYLYDADEVTRELLEELTKLLLARPNQLRKLGRHQEMTLTAPRVTVRDTTSPDLQAVKSALKR